MIECKQQKIDAIKEDELRAKNEEFRRFSDFNFMLFPIYKIVELNTRIDF